MDSLRVSHWGPTGEISTVSFHVELLVERPAVCEVTLTYARMLSRATESSFASSWADRRFGDRSTDCLWNSEEAERLEAPCDKAGHLCMRVVGRGAVPLPRFNSQNHPSSASYPHTADSRHAPISRLQPIYHRNLRAPTMLSLRFSLYQFTFNP